jgi:hypothetical protein
MAKNAPYPGHWLKPEIRKPKLEGMENARHQAGPEFSIFDFPFSSFHFPISGPWAFSYSKIQIR